MSGILEFIMALYFKVVERGVTFGVYLRAAVESSCILPLLK